MKKILLATVALLGLASINPANAQKEKEKSKENSHEQIIIMRKGDKDTKLTIETKDGEVFINGKPASEYKDDDIKISKEKTWNFDRDGNFNLAPLRGYFNMMDSSSSSKAFLGVVTEKSNNDLKIVEITEGSSAVKAGLKAGDVITKVGEKVVRTPEELSNAVSAYKPKDEIKISFMRDGKSMETKATLGERSLFRSFSFNGEGKEGMKYFEKLRDIKPLRELTEMHRFMSPDSMGIFKFERNNFGKARLGIKIQDTEDNSGVKVMDVEVGSAAEKAGLKKDDVLIEVAGNKVTNTDDARTQLAVGKDEASYNVKVKRNGATMNFDIKPVKKLKTTNL